MPCGFIFTLNSSKFVFTVTREGFAVVQSFERANYRQEDIDSTSALTGLVGSVLV